jgi:hypothetical protein
VRTCVLTLSVINYIKTPQQYKLFSGFQTLAHCELPADVLEEDRKVLEPVKPVVTRWNLYYSCLNSYYSCLNSYYSCFKRAVKLQSTVNAYSNYYIQRVRDEDTYTKSRGNKLPKALWRMRSDGLTAAN